MSNAKRHHFISQFYLAGFTSDGTKEGIIYSFDLKRKERRPQKVKEVGHEKYFNRVDAINYNSNIIEDQLAKFETEASKVFNKIIGNKSLPASGIELNTLFLYIALLGIRNPGIRKTIDEFNMQIIMHTMQFYLKDENTWNQLKQRAEQDGVTGISNLTFQEAKKYILETKWEMKSHNNDFIKIEFKSVEKVAAFLSYRNWSLIDATQCKLLFITSDRPVILFGKDVKSKSPLHAPGFGMKNTDIFFPISKQLFVLGSFNMQYPTIPATDEMIAHLNSLHFLYPNRYIFSSQDKFSFDNSSGYMVNSDILIS